MRSSFDGNKNLLLLLLHWCSFRFFRRYLWLLFLQLFPWPTFLPVLLLFSSSLRSLPPHSKIVVQPFIRWQFDLDNSLRRPIGEISPDAAGSQRKSAQHPKRFWGLVDRLVNFSRRRG